MTAPARRAAPTWSRRPAASKRRHGEPVLQVGPFLVFGLFIGFWYFMAFVGIEKILGKPKFFIPAAARRGQDAFFNWRQPPADARGALAVDQGRAGRAAHRHRHRHGAGHPDEPGQWVERSTYPYAVALQCLPILAFVPLLGLLFGYGINTRVVVCVMIALFPIIASTLFGLLSVDRSHHELFTLQAAEPGHAAVEAAVPGGHAVDLQRLPDVGRPRGDRRHRR